MSEGMSNEQIADVLADSREYMEQNGWCRHTILDNYGNVCLFGAVGMSQGWWDVQANGWRPETLPKVNAVTRFMEQHLPASDLGDPYAVTEWNDEYARDKQEVLDFLAKTEKIARFGSDPDA